MTGRAYRISAMLLLLGAVLVRIISMPGTGFFCDVPAHIIAIQSHGCVIQFPGYVPFHLLVTSIAWLTGSVFSGLLLLSFGCGMISMVYVMLAAKELQGPRAAIVSGGVMAFSILPVYFSVAGTSYTTDMLYISGMLYHGLMCIRRPRQANHYWLALCWLCFGIGMRPLSAVWSAPALCLLSLWRRDFRRLAVTVAIIGMTGLAYVAASIPFYGSVQAFLGASRNINGQLVDYSVRTALTNMFRVVIYPLYGLHLWLCFTLVALIRNRKNVGRPECMYSVCLVAPYLMILLRYIPHAGYYCLLLPVLAVLCWTVAAAPKSLFKWPGVILMTMFLGISLGQLFLLHPIRTKALYSGVANAYLLQYSRSGLKQGYFETLASVMYKVGGELRRQVPRNRQADIKRQMKSP